MVLAKTNRAVLETTWNETYTESAKALHLLKIIGIYHWKYPMSNSASMYGYLHECTDRSKPNVKFNLMRPYYSLQMRC